jgi:hypothetical protein
MGMKHRNLAGYATDLAEPYIAALLHQVGREFGCSPVWVMPKLDGSYEVPAAPMVRQSQQFATINVTGEAMLEESTWQVTTDSIRRGGEGFGTVRLAVQVAIVFDIADGMVSVVNGCEGVTCLARRYRAKGGGEFYLLETKSNGLLILTVMPNLSLVSDIARRDMRLLGEELVHIALASRVDTSNRDDQSRIGAGVLGLTSTDASGRRWVVKQSLAASATITTTSHNSQLYKRRDQVKILKPPYVQVIWLSQDGVVMELNDMKP